MNARYSVFQQKPPSNPAIDPLDGLMKWDANLTYIGQVAASDAREAISRARKEFACFQHGNRRLADFPIVRRDS